MDFYQAAYYIIYVIYSLIYCGFFSHLIKIALCAFQASSKHFAYVHQLWHIILINFQNKMLFGKI